ncbi:Exported zinc metalloprotease YfgC precursor [Caballeronia glathei]|jgi:predicted Zn-dependent protease|uniref:Peptidase M48 n=1 Tax=Caballeronia glathei TaxID=60547 RepID=A0A069PGE8_9BURK|nr:M48 family metalloprotease [Caballeronia glathei]KDR39758.1 peptidase M48 [Caballeronia glathei]CDY79934.1 Exported zinc metalloprotease YfgC precursor [Caballeronia glathei]
MRPNRLLTAVLCFALAVPPPGVALAQTAASAARPGTATTPAQSPTLAAAALRAAQPDAASSAAPGSVAEGVFGVYGGAESRFANRPGEMTGLRAPLSAVQLPDLGDGSGGSLTPQAERRLGERMMRELRREPDYLDDWLLRDYLNSVSAKLSAAAVSQYIGGYLPDFDLFAVRDAQINAFSMPGGFIGVNTGLIAATQTESELASVIGHEMGHVLQRHIARMISTHERSNYTALAAMLAGLLAGVVAKSGDLGMGIAMGGQAFAIDNQLRFSRSAEHEADRVGFQMLSAAGYDPYAMTAFFDRLDRSTMGDNGVPPYARTHPLTGERIADMEDRARRVPYRQPRQSPEYAFVRARSRVLQVNSSTDYREIGSRLKSEIEDQTALNAAANWYGIALAQTLIGDYGAANEALSKSRRLFDGEQASSATAQAQAQAESAAVQSRTDAAAASKNSRRTGAGIAAPSSGSQAGSLTGSQAGSLSRSLPGSQTGGTGSAARTVTNGTAVNAASPGAQAVAGLLAPPKKPADTTSTGTLAKPAAGVTSPRGNATTPAVTSLATPSRTPGEPGPAARNAMSAAPAALDITPGVRVRSTPSLDVLAAEIARRAGHNDEAVRLAELAQKRWPDSHAAIEVHLQALLSARRFAEAQALAKQETRAEPKRPDWWLYLAQSSVGLNDPLQQHQAMAEKFALDGAWPSAIRQLKEARDAKGATFYDLSTISARLRDFEARYREERDQDKDG